ncbi:MAG: hypothetical protein ABSF85_16650 [Terriglobales bacterium]|jgi:hypothetical protein
MTIADDIEALVERKQRRLHLIEEDIAEMLFGQKHAYQQRVNSVCRQLVKEKRLVREGRGGPANPYWYHLPYPKRRKV